MRRLIVGAAALLALSPFIALASASTPAGAAVTHPTTSASAATHASAAAPDAVIVGMVCEAGSSSTCVAPVDQGDVYDLTDTAPGVFVQNCGGSNGDDLYGNPQESYCEIHEVNLSICWQWDSTTNQVDAAACNGNILSQHWWWDGSKFRNLYAVQQSVNGVCLHAADTGNIVLDICKDGLTSWTWN